MERVVKSHRLGSLDAYRGFLMLSLVSGAYTNMHEAFAISTVLDRLCNNAVCEVVTTQLRHVPWEWGGFWDMLMPSFILVVGIGMVYSYEHRRAQGQPDKQILGHLAVRCIALVALGSVGLPFLENLLNREVLFQGRVSFVNVLCQIGFASPVVFFLLKQTKRVQITASAGILILYWMAFALWPIPATADNSSVLTAKTEDVPFYGFFRHWNPDINFAADADRWLFGVSGLNKNENLRIVLPTLNFIPTVVTMVIGTVIASLLRSPTDWNPTDWKAKEKMLLGLGVSLLLGGIGLGLTICPIVKAIWTPSWVLYAGGFSILLFLPFVWLVEYKRRDRWVFPFVVVGRNSILIYCLANILDYRVLQVWERLLGKGAFDGIFGPVWQALLFIVILWCIAYELNRRNIFVRL